MSAEHFYALLDPLPGALVQATFKKEQERIALRNDTTLDSNCSTECHHRCHNNCYADQEKIPDKCPKVLHPPVEVGVRCRKHKGWVLGPISTLRPYIDVVN